MASQKRTMLKRVAELCAPAVLTLWTAHIQPCHTLSLNGCNRANRRAANLPSSGNHTLLAVRTGWGELHRLAEMLRECVDDMPLPPPLPWKMKEIAEEILQE